MFLNGAVQDLREFGRELENFTTGSGLLVLVVGFSVKGARKKNLCPLITVGRSFFLRAENLKGLISKELGRI